MDISNITVKHQDNNTADVQIYSLYVGGDENHIEFHHSGVIYYKEHDITHKFIELVRSGFFDSLIDKEI